MPGNTVPASAFLPLLNCIRQASTFRHQEPSDTAGHVVVRHCPAVTSSDNVISTATNDIVSIRIITKLIFMTYWSI